MNRTKKRIFYLVACLYAVMFTLIVSGRMVSGVAPELMVLPNRPTAEALAQFEGFTSIRARGDFQLEVSRGDEFLIEYQSWSDLSGDIEISLEDEILFIGGWGNYVNSQLATVRIVMPRLDTVIARSLPVIDISGFDEPHLFLQTFGVYRLNLSDSRISELEVDSSTGDELNFTNVVTENRLIKTWGARHSKARIVDQ